MCKKDQPPRCAQQNTNLPTLQSSEALPQRHKEQTQADSQYPDCACHKTKERDDREYKDLMNRLKRIEGQVRGIQKMVEKNAYCTDILTQVSAVNAALNSFNKVLLANHLRTCVTEHIRQGDDEVIEELVTLLQKLMK